MRTVAGVDGCRTGWVCVAMDRSGLRAFVSRDLRTLVAELPSDAIVAIDVPIGLTESGPRACDLAARRVLRAPRASSVFSAPVRSCLSAASYADACEIHFQADGRRLSRQAFGILPKIREVDEVMKADPALQRRIREVHPEVCFAAWNAGRPMTHRKTSAEGRREREALIDAAWPAARMRLAGNLMRSGAGADDLNDAFAGLWTAVRLTRCEAVTLPSDPPVDAFGLRMEMVA